MRTLVIVVLLLLGGCEEPAASYKPVNNSTYSVNVLFTDDDGFTVKRFRDHGEYHYYVTKGTQAEFVDGAKKD